MKIQHFNVELAFRKYRNPLQNFRFGFKGENREISLILYEANLRE